MDMSEIAARGLVLLGCGKMGSAMALRLREHGQAVSVWNRSVAKAQQLRGVELPGDCYVSESPAAALDGSSHESLV